MKKALVIIFMLISISVFSQNRFENLFAEADSVFNILIEAKSDSLFVSESLKSIESLASLKVTMRAADVILLYWKGYTDCAIKVNEAGSIDYRELEKQIRQQVLVIQKLIRKSK